MPATVFTAVAAEQEVFCGKYPETICIYVIVLAFYQFFSRRQFLFTRIFFAHL